MINKTKNYKGGKKIDLPNKPFTITNPLSSTQKIQENAENIQKLNMEYIRVSSDDVLLKNFREEMKNGGVNSSQYNANKEHKDRLDKTKGAIKQIVKALDKLEKKNEAQDKEISEIESGTPEDVKDINVESSNVELGNANIKEDIKQINDRLKNVEGWTPPDPAKIKDIDVISTTTLNNSNVKEDIEQLKKEIDSIDTGGGEYVVLFDGDRGSHILLNDEMYNYSQLIVQLTKSDLDGTSFLLSGIIQSAIIPAYDGYSSFYAGDCAIHIGASGGSSVQGDIMMSCSSDYDIVKVIGLKK